MEMFIPESLTNRIERNITQEIVIFFGKRRRFARRFKARHSPLV
jgi:hypothetical protein